MSLIFQQSKPSVLINHMLTRKNNDASWMNQDEEEDEDEDEDGKDSLLTSKEPFRMNTKLI